MSKCVNTYIYINMLNGTCWSRKYLKKKTIDTEDLDKNGIITQGSKTFM